MFSFFSKKKEVEESLETKADFTNTSVDSGLVQKVVPVSTVLCACVLRCVFVSACAHTLAGEPPLPRCRFDAVRPFFSQSLNVRLWLRTALVFCPFGSAFVWVFEKMLAEAAKLFGNFYLAGSAVGVRVCGGHSVADGKVA